jgi:hypothetical protein
MRWLFCSLVLFSLVGYGQHKYLAAYESRMHFDFSQLKVAPVKINMELKGSDSVPSGVKDSIMQLLSSSAFLENMLKEQLGEEMVMYIHVRADSATAELEGYSGNKVKVNARKIYFNGKWVNAEGRTIANEQDSMLSDIDFLFTGNSKEIFGYTCHEVRSKDSLQKITLWVCKTLPSTISPGIKFKNMPWAIFEFINESKGTRTTLRSIQKIKESI